MENLKAYFSSIDGRLFKHVTGKPGEFIRVFREQNFLSEKAFAKALCGEGYDPKLYSAWKIRTLKILQAFAMISDGRGESLVKKKYDECQKKFFLGQKFMSQGQRTEGLRLVEEAYKIADRYDFSHLASELASILHRDYVYYHPNKKIGAFYDTRVKKHLADYMAEKYAEYYFYRIVAKQTHSSTSIEVFEEGLSNINALQGDSIKYRVYQGIIKTLFQLYSGEYKQLVVTCKEMLRFFRNSEGVYPTHYLFFLVKRGLGEMALRQYRAAKRTYQACEEYAMNSTYNISTLEFYKTLNALHSGRYQIAYDLYQKNKRCKIEDIRQKFAIIEAYLCFLCHAGFLQINKIFRMSKFLNDTLKAQTDKQGDNINIVIAQLLMYLVRDRGQYIDYVETVENYSYRHLKGVENNRAKWFLKILCILAHPRVGFHPKALKRKAGRYMEKLDNHPIRMGGNFMIEVIPYDHLLNMILTKVISRAA